MPALPEEPSPYVVASERESLVAWLDFHRAVLLAKCEGLEPLQLATRSVPPSALSLLGLVRHMSEVERHWFVRVQLGVKEPPRYCEEDRDGDFNAAAPENAAEGLANFRADCDRSRQIAADTASLDSMSAGTRRGRPVSFRWIMTHMVEEYARHNGHADLLRECIDGEVG